MSERVCVCGVDSNRSSVRLQQRKNLSVCERFSVLSRRHSVFLEWLLLYVTWPFWAGPFFFITPFFICSSSSDSSVSSGSDLSSSTDDC